MRPRNNYGVALERLFVVDIDTRNGGIASWKQLIADKEPAPTWRARTGGGWHVFYSRPASDVPHFKPLPGIDIKCGHGAYVVGAGCRHYTGGVYVWDTLWHPHKVPLALPPDWLLEALSPPNKAARPLEHYKGIAAAPLKNGERNTRLAQLFAHLYANLINPDDELILEIAQGWNLGRGAPPLDPEEVEDVVAGVAYREYRSRGFIK